MTAKSTGENIAPYQVACIQAAWETYNPNVHGEYEGEAFKRRNLQRMCDYIDFCFAFGTNQPPVKLVCFSEFSLGGVYSATTTNEQVKKWQAITMPGPETDILAEKAKKYDCYIAAVNHENDPDWPDTFFNTAFIINPKGKIILKYRKMNTAYGCNPHDIMDKYVNPITGKKDFFPVVDTKIGRLACFVCGDLMIPEIPRMEAMNGAEVILHLNGGFVHEIAAMALQVRAWDNTVYIVEQNNAGAFITTGDFCGKNGINPTFDATGGGQCRVIDFYGKVIAQTPDRCPQVLLAPIDIMKLREVRRQFRMGIYGGDSITRCRAELYRSFYANTIFPPNKVFEVGFMTRLNDEGVTRRRQEALANRQKMMNYYSEDDVK